MFLVIDGGWSLPYIYIYITHYIEYLYPHYNTYSLHKLTLLSLNLRVLVKLYSYYYSTL